ncbi:MAG: hypothetical protein JSR82_09860 [Verrucomicrobia bacterium]|nr:hypothetical protein [Verrucomicrobiota bacterium]
MKAILRNLAAVGAFLAALPHPSSLRAQVVQPTTPPWRWLWVGSDNPVDTWGSANSRNGGALTGNWLLFPNDTPAPPITRPRTGSDWVVIDPGQSSLGTLGETITGELNCRLEPQSSWTVGRLELAAGTSLTLQGNSTLSLTTTPATGYATFSGAGNVQNHGDIRLAAGGYLSMAVAGTISGGGTITMSPADGVFGDSTLGGNNLNTAFNLAGVTVRGAGQIRGGANFAATFTNSGLFDANLPGKSLIVITSGNNFNGSFTAPPSTNTGIFRASNGGTLQLTCFGGAGTLQNAGGRFEALDGSTVRLDNAVTVVGGTLATTGSGIVRSASAFLRDVTNTGFLQVGDPTSGGDNLSLVNSFTNSGTVRIGTPTSLISAKLFLRSSITLNGGGRLVLASSDLGTVSGYGNPTLTNPSGAIIEGTGGLGYGGENGGFGSSSYLSLANAGLLDANVNARGLFIVMNNTAGVTLTNTGTMRASAGGILVLSGIDVNNEGTYDNTDGRIEALAGSSVQLRSGAVIRNGTLATAGSGVIQLGLNGFFNGGVLRDVVNTGQLTLSSGFFAGTVTNSGAGVTTLTDAQQEFRSSTFLNQAGATFNSVGGTRLSGTGTFRNAGRFARTGSSFSTMQAEVAFENTGTVYLEGFQQFGSYRQSAGVLQFGPNGSTQTASGQPLVFTGGAIVGTGSFQTSVTNSGNLTLGATDGSPTSLRFQQSFTQDANATLTVNVGGTADGAFGVLKVDGTANLAGNVVVQLVNGFRFRVGDTFQLVSAGTRNGNFASLTLPAGVNGSLSASGGNVTLTITAAPASTSLINISTRARVETGDNVLIGGFVIGGTASKRVIVRALGPSLVPFGVSNAISNPTLRLVNSATGADLASNDNWRSAQQADIQASGFAPTNDNESAIVATLSPGSYTAIVAGVGGEQGVALVEVYDLDRGGRESARPLNVSTRAKVLTGDQILIGGFVVEGARERRVIVRAIGPSLTGFGVQGALSNPTLEVKDAGGATIGTNDDWKSAQQASIAASGFAPTNDAESAVILTLPPGAYTALVRGVGSSTGVALVEVYDLE